MKSKSDKGSKSAEKSAQSGLNEKPENITGKNKNIHEDDELDDTDDIETTPVKSAKGSAKSKTASDDDEEDDAVADEADDWEKTEDDDENWDPDFDEFDIPKSGAKAGVSKKKDDDDDFKVDDEFKDLYSGGGSGFDDEEDDY